MIVETQYADDAVDPSLLKDLQSVFDDIQNRYASNPSTFKAPIEAFIKSYRKMHTESAVVSSLHCFGKYSGLRPSTSRLLTGKRIGVQPTAVARRKVLSGSRRCAQLGRPFKSTLADKRDVSTNVRHALPPRRKVAPHNLSVCVSNNQALGKTHSAK